MNRAALVLAIALAACDVETPPVLPGTEPAPCDLVASDWAITVVSTSLLWPAAGAAWKDLDGDGAGDARLNAAVANLSTAGFYSPWLASGTVHWSLRIERCAGELDDHVRVSVHDGLPDQPLPPDVVAAVGARDAIDVIRTTEGISRIPLVSLFDVRAPGSAASLLGYATHVDLWRETSTELEGTLAFAIPVDVAIAELSPALARTVNALVRADPGCPDACENDMLQLILNFDDDDHDGFLSVLEAIEAAWLWHTAPQADLFATWDGQRTYWPTHDGVADSLGIGLYFLASPLNR